MKHLKISPALYDYMLDISLCEHPILQALRTKTSTLELANMQIEPLQAQFLQFLIQLTQSKKILELGTFTGYSALAMALALPEDGELITCDQSAEWTAIAKPYWTEAGQDHKIILRLGKALDSLNELENSGHLHSFDFIFIDADKTNYVPYYEKALTLIKPSGFIAIDNILWDGQVIDDADKSAQTREIKRLNAHIQQDTRIERSLLAIADGLFLIKLKGQSSHR